MLSLRSTHISLLALALSAALPVQTVFVADLKPGHIVVSDIQARSGAVLLSRGSRLSDMIVQRLRNYSSLGDVQEPVMVQIPPA